MIKIAESRNVNLIIVLNNAMVKTSIKAKLNKSEGQTKEH